MIVRGSKGNQSTKAFDKEEAQIRKKDLKNFNKHLREMSDQRILANKTFAMLNRLEKAVAQA